MAFIAFGVVLGVGVIQSIVDTGKQKKAAEEAAEYRKRQVDKVVHEKLAEIDTAVKQAQGNFDKHQIQIFKLREILTDCSDGKLDAVAARLRDLSQEEFAFLGTKLIDASSENPENQETVIDLILAEQERRDAI